jgi:hypothetical protein
VVAPVNLSPELLVELELTFFRQAVPEFARDT